MAISFPAEAAVGSGRFDHLVERMRTISRARPDLIRMIDIGDGAATVNGTAQRDIWALQVGAPSQRPDAPHVLHVAGQHGNEIVNPELLLAWAERAANLYGRDPKVTAALNAAVVNLVPVLNTDGYDASAPTRRNARGVDLNRNHAVGWAPRPHHGPQPASEPETQALERFVSQTKPTVLVNWHSWTSANLYPKLHGSDDAARNAAGASERLAHQLGMLNGYRAQPSDEWYPVEGSTIDWANARGIAANVVETGRSFNPTAADQASTIAKNLDAIDYTAMIARDPRALTAAPQITSADVAPDGTVRAEADFPPGWLAHVHGARLILDLDSPGEGVDLRPVDGRADSGMERFEGPVPVDWIERGERRAFVVSTTGQGVGPPVPIELPRAVQQTLPFPLDERTS